MTRRVWVIAALLASASTARADLLEAPRQRQGYYLAFGAAGAMSFAAEDGETYGPMSGFLGSIRLGQLLTTHLGLGLNLDFGGASGDGASAGFFGIGLGGQLEVATNLAVHAAVGLGVVSLDDPLEEDVKGVTGAAYTIGLTYDWFPWKRRTGGWALTPSLRLRAVPGDADAYAVFFGVEITRWTGLSKNQLDLPPTQAY